MFPLANIQEKHEKKPFHARKNTKSYLNSLFSLSRRLCHTDKTRFHFRGDFVTLTNPVFIFAETLSR